MEFDPIQDTSGRWRRAIVRLPAPRVMLRVDRGNGAPQIILVPEMKRPSGVRSSKQ